MRERYRLHDAVLIGFTTHTGTVTAAVGLGRARRYASACAPSAGGELRAPVPSNTGSPASCCRTPRTDPDLGAAAGGEPRLERAIGVSYRPATERASHYFACLVGHSSTTFSTSRRRARSSRWTADRHGRRASSGDVSRQGCEGADLRRPSQQPIDESSDSTETLGGGGHACNPDANESPRPLIGVIMRTRMMATLTFAALLLTATIGQAQTCLHGPDESPAQRARRTAAIRFVQQVNDAEEKLRLQNWKF